MKKFLAIFLALIMVLSVCLVACSKKKPSTDDENDWEGEDTYNALGTGDSSSAVTEDSDDDNTPSTSGEWIDKSDTVYVGINGTNLREGPGKSYKVGTKVNFGTALTRTGTNGTWDKVTYNGGEYYVDSDLVTTDGNDFSFEADLTDPVVLTVVGDYTVNLRTSPFYSADFSDENMGISGFDLTNTSGTNILKKLAVSKSGDWYKVSYTGTTADGKTYTDTTFYLAFSSVSAGYVNDPSAPSNPSNGEQGIG